MESHGQDVHAREGLGRALSGSGLPRRLLLVYSGVSVKAAILVAQNSPLVLADVEIPKLAVGQVLVKIAFSGICGKQLDEISGRQGNDPYLPHLLEHEGAGTVTE